MQNEDDDEMPDNAPTGDDSGFEQAEDDAAAGETAPEEETAETGGESDAEPADGDAVAEAVDDASDGETDPDEEDGDESGEADDDENGESAEADAPSLPVVSVVEAVLFAAREPLKLAQIARAVGKRTRQEVVKTAIEELNLHYLETGRAFEIAEISGRLQLMSRPEYAPHIMRLYPKRETGEKDKTARLSPAALDTLSIIAYKQPVTRGEIERIRGVGCGPVLRALIERGTVKVAGKRADLVGQPLVYGTTEAFLAEFGLGSLDELPLRNEFLGAFAEEEATIADVAPEPAAEEPAEEEPPVSEEQPAVEEATEEEPSGESSEDLSAEEEVSG